MSLIKSFAEAKEQVDENAPVTRVELRAILSNGPVPALANQANIAAQQINNLIFRFDVLIEYMAVRGVRKGPDTRFYLDPKDWNQFLKRAVDRQNAAVEKEMQERIEKQKAAAQKPV